MVHAIETANKAHMRLVYRTHAHRSMPQYNILYSSKSDESKVQNKAITRIYIIYSSSYTTVPKIILMVQNYFLNATISVKVSKR